MSPEFLIKLFGKFFNFLIIQAENEAILVIRAHKLKLCNFHILKLLLNLLFPLLIVFNVILTSNFVFVCLHRLNFFPQ